MRNKILLYMGLVILPVLFNLNTYAQNNKGTVSGFVYDAVNGEALIGATVHISAARMGASTNNSGYFVIHNVAYGEQKIVGSFMGYRSDTLVCTVGEKQDEPLIIRLSPGEVRLQEVVVTSASESFADKLFVEPVSQFSMTSREINNIPKVIEADLLRALQTTPGITALSDFSSALYVRGGTPDQNLFLIDGADVYNPDHAFGIFSTFNTNAIKKVNVSKGGFGSEYGGRLSSVIDVTNLDGNRNNYEGVANISLLSGSTTMQIPVGDFGSLSASIRRTYIDKTYAKWSKDIPEYYFYDGNVKGFFELSSKDKLTVSLFKSKDDLVYRIDKDAKDSPGFFYDWGNTTGSLNLKHIFSPVLFASFWVTMSDFRSDFKFDKITNLTEVNSLKDRAFKTSLEYYPNSELSVKFGAEHKQLKLVFDEDFNDGLVNIEQNSTLSTAYVEGEWKPTPVWTITGGFRAAHFAAEEKFTNIEPRFTAKYRLSTENSVKFSYGIYHQYLNRIPRMFFASIWATADNNIEPSSADHIIAGYEHRLPGDLQFEAEVYYKRYHDIHEFNQNLNAVLKPDAYTADGKPEYHSTKGIFRRGDGDSRGLELLLRKESGTVTGWVSYTYSQTKHTFDGVNKNNEYAPRHDRNNVVNLVLNGELGSIFSSDWNTPREAGSSKWLLGVNFVYASGQPLSVPSSSYYVNTVPRGDEVAGEDNGVPGYKLYPTEINTYRLPAYIRMDVSLTYEKDYGSFKIAPYLQVFNIGNRKNLWFVNYESEFDNNTVTQSIKKVAMLPFLPSVGINITF